MQEQDLPKVITPEGNSVPAVEVTPPAGNYEQSPNTATSPEIAPAPGDSISQADPALQYLPVNLPQPISQPAPVPVTTSPSDSTAPAVADDVDVIEKVWVEKAKAIVKQTQNDPYTQEEQVSSLQEDYQKKRYGKDKLNK